MGQAGKPQLAQQWLWFLIGLASALWIAQPYSWRQLDHPITLVVATMMVTISESWPIELGRGHISLSSAGYVSALWVAGLTGALAAIVAGMLLSWLVRGVEGLRSLATIALLALTLKIAAPVFHEWPREPVLGVVLFAVVFIAINHLGVNIYYFLREDRVSLADIWLSLGWDGLGWFLGLPLAAIFILLDRAYHAWWVALLGIAVYASVTLLLTFYYQSRTAHVASRRTAAAAESITAAVDKEVLVGRVRDAFQGVLGFTIFVLYLREAGTGLLRRALAVYPDEAMPYPEVFSPASTGLTAWAVATRLPEFIDDSRRLPSANPATEDGHPVRSGFILPLVTDRETVGIIVLGYDYPHGYKATDFETAKVLAHHTAMAYRKWSFQEEALLLARVDPLLPSVYNFRYFREVVAWRMAHWPDRPMALAVLDLDGFKAVNDRYGHLVGDRVLQQFADLIQSTLRERDLFARYGGDEFVVLLDNVEENGAVRAVERMQAVVARHHWEELPQGLGASAGFALWPQDGDTADSLLNTADLRMYGDKEARKQGPMVPFG